MRMPPMYSNVNDSYRSPLQSRRSDLYGDWPAPTDSEGDLPDGDLLCLVFRDRCLIF